MSDSFPSLRAVAYASAPRLRIPPEHREPNESHGSAPFTTLSGRLAGILKCERNSWTKRLSKSFGSSILGSSAATDILTIIETVSAAFSVSRHPTVATLAGLDEPALAEDLEPVAQAATKTSGATVRPRGRRRTA